MNKFISFIVTSLLIVSCYKSDNILLAQNIIAAKQYPEVTLSNTELRTIKSAFVDQEYQLQIYLPPSYSDFSKSFPVLYLLDSDKSFGMAKDIVEWLIWGEEIPEIMIVGIAYGEGTKAWWNKRLRDYTPSKDKTKVWGDFPSAGEANNFKKFIAKELMSFVDNNYRTQKNEKIIAGLSAGGLFATYVLFTEPELFQKYIMSGSAYLWDDKIIFKYEEDFSQKHDSLSATVYLVMGGYEDIETLIRPWEEFTAIIKQRNYKGLKIWSEIIEGETHFSAWPVCLSRGIKKVLSEK